MRANVVPKGWQLRWTIALGLAALGSAELAAAAAGDSVAFPASQWLLVAALVVAIVAGGKALRELLRARRVAEREQLEALTKLGQRIRTPLNGVVGMSQLLLSSPLDPEQREYVRTIRSSADALVAIVDEMSNLATLRPGSPIAARSDARRDTADGGSTVAAGEPARQRPHYGRVLVAEDNAVNQRVVMLLLKRLGYSSDAVGDGRAAIAALREKAYDLVLMDCQMPELDGWAATRLIRDPANGALDPSIPIVALTANATAEDREQALAAGMNDYLLKPIDFEQFESTLQRWLNSTSSGAVAASEAVQAMSATASITAAPAKTAALSVFDRDEALRRLLNDAALLQVVVDALLEDLPRQTAALDAARQAGDAVSLSRHAHSIKGAAANVGAEALRAVARELEHAAGAVDWQRIRTLRPALDLEIERFRSEVRQASA
jgi:CheY-like chemotaxis protein